MLVALLLHRDEGIVLALSTEVWFPIVTLAIGYAAKSLTDWLQDRRHAARDRASRSEARRDQILLRRADFQRQTLLELQEAAAQLTRKTAQAIFENLDALNRKGGEWAEHPHPIELAESLRSARAIVSKLTVRVRDSAVVTLTDDLAILSVECTLADDQETAFSKFDEASNIANQLNSRIGAVLRELDDFEDRELDRSQG